MNMIAIVLAAMIELTGVTGNNLRARAFFDVNNVKVGDPMVLTIDFLGEADFHNLHPPALAKMVNRKDWKVDDISAKTDTFRDARRLTYRVRPMRDGVLYFPALEFSYVSTDDEEKVVKSNEIPVHAKKGSQVVVAEMDAMGEQGYPKPPEIINSFGNERLSDGDQFAWRKAISHPTADGFARFDFPVAKMNEATCAIREGNWARAMKIYRVLEWKVGQTPEIERGVIAALALKFENPNVELPVWRQVLRPLLKFEWKLRLVITFVAFSLVILVFWLIGRGIHAVASIALMTMLFMPFTVEAQGLFEQMEEQMRQMRQRMQQMTGGFSMSFGGEEQQASEVKASLAMSKSHPQVGEAFEFIVALEMPMTSSVEQIRIVPSQNFGMTITGEARSLGDGKSDNVTNVIKRIAVPVRYDVPFKGEIAFTISGMISGRRESGRRGRSFMFSFSNSFQAATKPIRIEIKPLSTAGQPSDFAGIVSEGLRLHETCDLIKVGSNDVVTITYRMYQKGYVPAEFIVPGAAFEWTRDERSGMIEYRRFLVANGVEATPKVSVSYYDPRTKSYRRAECGGTKLVYIAE